MISAQDLRDRPSSFTSSELKQAYWEIRGVYESRIKNYKNRKKMTERKKRSIERQNTTDVNMMDLIFLELRKRGKEWSLFGLDYDPYQEVNSDVK